MGYYIKILYYYTFPCSCRSAGDYSARPAGEDTITAAGSDRVLVGLDPVRRRCRFSTLNNIDIGIANYGPIHIGRRRKRLRPSFGDLNYYYI